MTILAFNKKGVATLDLGGAKLNVVISLETTPELEDVKGEPKALSQLPVVSRRKPSISPKRTPVVEDKPEPKSQGYAKRVHRSKWLGYCQFKPMTGDWKTVVICERFGNGRIRLAWLGKETLANAKWAYVESARTRTTKAKNIRNIVWY